MCLCSKITNACDTVYGSTEINMDLATLILNAKSFYLKNIYLIHKISINDFINTIFCD